MSTAQPIRPRMVGKVGFSFAIVASQYNLPFVQGMVEHAHREINELEPGANTKLVWAPGSFEIPVLAKFLAEQRKFHALLCLGVVLQGETAHASIITNSVASALQNIAVEYTLPVINEVLLLDNEEQARKRCLEGEINRGTEAARAAISTARTIRDLTPKTV